jgi:4-hydroxybenzoate polyprenyltransferase
MKHFIRLTRPLNLLITAATMYGFGWYLESLYSNGDQFGIRTIPFLILVISTVLIAAAGNIINDYFDVRADRVNKPERLIIGVHLKRRWAIISHWLFNILAFSMAVYLSWIFESFWYLFIHLLSINLLWGYSSYFKRRLIVGNVVIAALTALVPVLVALYFFQHPQLEFSESKDVIYPFIGNADFTFLFFVTGVFALFAFTLNLAREMIKDIQDVEGDKLLHARTFPIVFGIRMTKLFCYVILSGALSGILFLVLMTPLSDSASFAPIVIAALFTTLSIFSLVLAVERKGLKKVDLFLKLAMVAGMLAPVVWKYIFINNGF